MRTLYTTKFFIHLNFKVMAIKDCKNMKKKMFEIYHFPGKCFISLLLKIFCL